MKEDVLQYIWKTQSFDSSNILTTKGKQLTVLSQGTLNTDAGPDFINGRVLIDGIEWAGDIEIHTTSSQWFVHKHHLDHAYNKVILHVVWEHDKNILRADGSKIPTIELKDIVEDLWLERYRMLVSSMQTIPCQIFLNDVDRLYLSHAFSRALMERLKRKSSVVLDILESVQGDWNRAAYRFLIQNFGFKKNSEAFHRLGLLVEYEICRKLESLYQVEAYLFGMAGLIPKKSDHAYVSKLNMEFTWIKRKFSISKAPMSSSEWLFMRMRPANFPTLRIAQLSMFLFKNKNFFRSLIELQADKSSDFFRINQSEFWQSHYHFNRESSRVLTGIGKQSGVVLSINVASVLLMAYGEKLQNDDLINKAMIFLETVPSEKNAIISKWSSLDISIFNAAESQGAIELFNNYCKKAGCLSCSVGNKILKPT